MSYASFVLFCFALLQKMYNRLISIVYFLEWLALEGGWAAAHVRKQKRLPSHAEEPNVVKQLMRILPSS